MQNWSNYKYLCTSYTYGITTWTHYYVEAEAGFGMQFYYLLMLKKIMNLVSSSEVVT